MFARLFHHRSPFRIFIVSAIFSALALGLTWYFMGIQAAFVVFILMIIEVTFSFDNAIINARILATMSDFWQRIFMTIGIVIAVFGMRIIFPIIIVMVSSRLSWSRVIDLALHHQEEYAHVLIGAHPSIAGFGGMFLLMLCLHFMFDKTRSVHWIHVIERPLQRIGTAWLPAILSVVVLTTVVALQPHHHQMQVFVAGCVGIVVYFLLHAISEAMERSQQTKQLGALKVGMAGFMAFLYLEVLDASFSLDGVIGAFAVTQNVIIIAVGLGIGALWVRSLTLFMVHHKILKAYRYLEHGAYYTIGLLALILLVGLFYEIPQVVIGSIGVVVIAASIVSSRHATKRDVRANS
jgi:hypothetical protein